jgi:prepilin-type processing-associated H-X9-DG protein
MNWLNPYLGGRFDPDSGLDWFYSFPTTPTVFNCPAEKPRYFPGLFGAQGRTSYNLGYGYNELGTGWKDGTLRLGLGFKVDFSGYGSNGQPLGPRYFVNSGDIRNPSNLIAVGDSSGGYWLTPNYSGYSESSLLGPHTEGSNVALCDGHVEYCKNKAWAAPTEAARKRWNNDNQPHPETW